MGQLLFPITGITQKQSKRMRRLSHQAQSGLTIIAWIIVGGLSIYGIGSVLPNMTAILTGKHIIFTNGQPFIGNHVIVVRDESGSMNGKEPSLYALINKLRTSELIVEPLTTDGFGVSESGSQNNLLHKVKDALNENPLIDTIYAFSDFYDVQDKNWESDQNGYLQLKTLLTKHNVRLYIGTVQYDPSNELIKIARESGGGFIE